MEKKEKIEEFKIKKIVEELKKIWARNIRKKSFTFSLSKTTFPKVLPPSLLEKTSNKFLKEFDWEKFEKVMNLERDLGLFLSAFLKKNIENYILSQKRKGVEEEKIKPIKVHLELKKVPVLLKFLGYKNPKKLHLVIRGDCGVYAGKEMVGGKIIIKGDCGDCVGWGIRNGSEIIVEGSCGDCPGWDMRGGKMIIKGNCGDCVGWRMQDGKIIIKGSCGSETGQGMRGGVLIVENCGRLAGQEMRGGKLLIEGKVETFDETAFSFDNQGIVILERTEIWRKGNWTRKGREMWKRGEIPIE